MKLFPLCLLFFFFDFSLKANDDCLLTVSYQIGQGAPFGHTHMTLYKFGENGKLEKGILMNLWVNYYGIQLKYLKEADLKKNSLKGYLLKGDYESFREMWIKKHQHQMIKKRNFFRYNCADQILDTLKGLFSVRLRGPSEKKLPVTIPGPAYLYSTKKLRKDERFQLLRAKDLKALLSE